MSIMGFWAASRAMELGADAARGAQRSTGDVQRQSDRLEARLDRALLACEALWTIVRDRLNVSEEELIQRVTEIDMSDGRLDGKARKSAVRCPKCDRTIAPRFGRCMYCGQAIMQDPFA